ncbi:MAG: hypothetical protein IKV94_01155 [Clostridia bacterium]|nr:hypothetical protein [Clostridia bacterium]
MKKSNAVTLEELNAGKVKKEKNKEYNLLEFFKNKLAINLIVCICICIVITLISIFSAVGNIKELDTIPDGNLKAEITNRLEMNILTLVAAIVPYLYMPYLGLAAYMYNEVVGLGFVIVKYGWLVGVLRYILPFTLNIISICLIVSVGVYLAKIHTARFIINRKNTMNFTTFRIRVYQMLKKQEKADVLAKKQENKTKKMEKRIEKVDWKNVCIFVIGGLLLQIISTLIQYLLV